MLTTEAIVRLMRAGWGGHYALHRRIPTPVRRAANAGFAPVSPKGWATNQRYLEVTGAAAANTRSTK
jgi:hypothetical protein